MKENKDTACEPCEQNFERNINRLVKEGKAPTPKARQQKEHEVKSAFAETGKERKYTFITELSTHTRLA